MIKKFFATLTKSTNRHEEWQKNKMEMQARINNMSREREIEERRMAEERRQNHLRNIPEEERMRRLKEDVEKTVESREKAA